MKTTASQLSLISHLGLYSTFHHSTGNRLVHALGTPLVLFSGELMLNALSLPLHLGIVLTVAAGILFSIIDVRGAALSMLWLLPMALIADALSNAFWWMPLAGLALHGLSWLGVAKLGHEVIERPLSVSGSAQDSNYYFREGFFVGRNLGVSLDAIDRLIQFAIAPFALTYDVLFSAGALQSLSKRIAARSTAIRSRLEAGLTPLSGAES